MGEIIVYLDSYEYSGDGYYEVIYLDFRTIMDYIQFVEEFKVEDTPGLFLEIRGYQSPKRLFPDSYYALNIEMLRDVRPVRNQESLLIGYTYDFRDYGGRNDENFQLLMIHEQLDPIVLSSPHHHTIPSLNLEVPAGKIELRVNNVGQANWNEILQDGKVKMVYDIGAPANASKGMVRQFAETYQQDRPDLVLSHWDKDHYHCLLEMTDEELGCFSRFICVDMIRSETPYELFGRLEDVLGEDRIFCYPLDTRTPKTPYPKMHEKFSNGVLSLFEGEKSRSRNYSGFVLFAQGSESHALLTGDCLICQAEEVIQHLHSQERLINSYRSKNDHYLVVPHHGGGINPKFMSYHIPAGINAAEAFISVDENNALSKIYKHPSEEMIAFLERFFKRDKIVRTDEEGKKGKNKIEKEL